MTFSYYWTCKDEHIATKYMINHMMKLNTKICWYEKYQYSEKKVSCWNKCSVLKSDIETVWCMLLEKHCHCPMNMMFVLFWIIWWPETVRRVNTICFYTLLYYVEFCIFCLTVHDSLWLLVTLVSLQNMKINHLNFLFCLV